jgi:hypothetical protein
MYIVCLMYVCVFTRKYTNCNAPQTCALLVCAASIMSCKCLFMNTLQIYICLQSLLILSLSQTFSQWYILTMPTINRPKRPTKAFASRHKDNDTFYNSKEWRNVSKAVRTAEPLCRECMRTGRIKPATLVDHIRPIRQGGAKYDLDNLQPLCTRCHNKKSATEKQKA